MYEKRKPALIDNTLLVFVAPFFVIFEIAHKFGYKAKEVREWNKVIAKEIDAYRKANKIQ